MNYRPISASFRDPSGFLFRSDDGTLYRQVNTIYEADFRNLSESGLYDALTKQRLLVPHQVENDLPMASSEGYCIIRPQLIPLITYPYEWSFSGLKDAATLTLRVAQLALKHGMQLKDASAYNVQFQGCDPIFIDTLSFETYKENQPWIAYGQFCRHFLAPLALMSKTHIDLSKLLINYIDGIPLDLASRLLPWKTRFSFGMQLHIHLHSKMIDKHSGSSREQEPEGGSEDHGNEKTPSKGRMPKHRLLSFLESLQKTVESLKWKGAGTEWANYYSDHSYDDSGFQEKRTLVSEFLSRTNPKVVWDLGANTGVFSRLACELGATTYAFDIDPACVENNYLLIKKKCETNLLPLRLDLTNPSPAIGWAHQERESIAQRGQADTIMALALIHHMAISNNVPLGSVAEYFSRLGKHLIIEFVPKGDPQVQRLLRTREDIFDQYDQESFEKSFSIYYEIQDHKTVGSDGRVLYQMVRKNS